VVLPREIEILFGRALRGETEKEFSPGTPSQPGSCGDIIVMRNWGAAPAALDRAGEG
jgi:hypothetical protein